MGPPRNGPRKTDPAKARRFAALVLPHASAAHNLALRLTRHADAAEDVVHDAYVRALSGFDGFRGGDARAWILTIVRRRAYDWLNARRDERLGRIAPFAADDPDQDAEVEPYDPEQETPEQALIRKGEAAGVHALINALPPRLREVLVLREMEDLSYREIAAITDAPIGSVMSRLARARAQFGEAWRRLHGSEEFPE